jgi:hypothetical protein
MKLNNTASEDFLLPGTVLKLSQKLDGVLKNQAPAAPRKSSNADKVFDRLEDSKDEYNRKSMGFKGEISNIEEIYNHVLEEGKKGKESLQRQIVEKGLLSFFQSSSSEDTPGGKIEDYVDFKNIH